MTGGGASARLESTKDRSAELHSNFLASLRHFERSLLLQIVRPERLPPVRV